MLQNKTAWITGAGTGIGLAGAQALAEAGAVVVLSGRRHEVLAKEADKISQSGASVEVAALDVTDANAVAEVAEKIVKRHGRLDILVNSAGLNTPNRFFRDQTVEGWDKVIRVNLDGSFYCVRAVLPAMREQKDGLIINIASWAGIYASAVVGAAYNSSKHAVVAMTTTINMEECANGIRACAVCPGETATPIMKKRPVPPPAEVLARMLQPADLGRTIAWLAAQPKHMCVNEIIISPTWNRSYLGGADLKVS